MALRRHGGGGGNPPGGGGGGGGAPAPAQPAPAPQAVVPQAADIQAMGTSPRIFEGNRAEAEDFLNELRHYYASTEELPDSIPP
jgi:hypothetical protein